MTQEELDNYLDQNKNHIEWRENGGISLQFRSNELQYYQADPERCTAITKELLFSDGFRTEDLYEAITRGLRVRGIARVTGYYAMVEGFNKGKVAELRDRIRFNVDMKKDAVPGAFVAKAA